MIKLSLKIFSIRLKTRQNFISHLLTVHALYVCIPFNIKLQIIYRLCIMFLKVPLKSPPSKFMDLNGPREINFNLGQTYRVSQQNCVSVPDQVKAQDKSKKWERDLASGLSLKSYTHPSFDFSPLLMTLMACQMLFWTPCRSDELDNIQE